MLCITSRINFPVVVYTQKVSAFAVIFQTFCSSEQTILIAKVQRFVVHNYLSFWFAYTFVYEIKSSMLLLYVQQFVIKNLKIINRVTDMGLNLTGGGKDRLFPENYIYWPFTSFGREGVKIVRYMDAKIGWT